MKEDESSAGEDTKEKTEEKTVEEMNEAIDARELAPDAAE